MSLAAKILKNSKPPIFQVRGESDWQNQYNIFICHIIISNRFHLCLFVQMYNVMYLSFTCPCHVFTCTCILNVSCVSQFCESVFYVTLQCMLSFIYTQSYISTYWFVHLYQYGIIHLYHFIDMSPRTLLISDIVTLVCLHMVKYGKICLSCECNDSRVTIVCVVMTCPWHCHFVLSYYSTTLKCHTFILHHT